jgi:hypothetical protein
MAVIAGIGHASSHGTIGPLAGAPNRLPFNDQRWSLRMISFRRFIVLAGAAVSFGILHSPAVEAHQDGFFFAPFSGPWSGPFYNAPPRERYSAPARKRKADRSVQREVKQTRRTRQAALAVAPKVVAVQKSISCEKAQAIVAEYGFKNIKIETCDGTTYVFGASGDGNPFSIQIAAANGELAKVQRIR